MKDTDQGIGHERSDFYVYTWSRPDTGEVFYVGKGHGNRDKNLSGRNKLFRSILDKLSALGMEPTVERVSSGLTEIGAFQLEAELVSHYGRRDLGTGSLANFTDGGEGRVGSIVSLRTRKKKSLALARTLQDPAVRKKWSRAQFTRYEDPAQRELTSLALKKRYEDPSEREKTAAALRGIPKSSEHIKHVREALLASWESDELRAAHRRQSLKRGPSKANKSGFKGVSFDASTGKWLAQIEVAGKNKHLGRYGSAAEAGKAYDDGAVKFYGRDVYLNFPDAAQAANDNEIATEQSMKVAG
ncbi:hypothetical protein [Pseudaminobacter sp. NGMCC 1.201702]|uniref:hypothetical protein n=1 Tax=Pseudaminobacter sp. NGMCC 1.201702 TaxID=3391825 RepID=UPI0039EECF77